MKGVVTADDVVAVVEEEATEDIQKLGGSEALGRTVPEDRVRAHGTETCRVAVGAVSGRDAYGDGHGVL
jgi:hypothetical protein